MAKKYSLDIKNAAIQKRLSGRTIKSINEEYGLANGTLHSWMKEYNESISPEQRSENEELARVRKENADLKKELDFLKKAASYFASQRDQ